MKYKTKFIEKWVDYLFPAPLHQRKKILIVRFSSIGDIVLTTPVIRCLRLQTGAEIHFLTKRSYQTIVQANPYIDKIWTIEKKISEIQAELKNEKFDLIIDLHKNLRTLNLRLVLRVKTLSFDKLNFQKWLMVKFKINRLPKIHIVERNLETVKSLGVKNDGKGLDYFIPEKDKVDLNVLCAINSKLETQHSKFIIAFAIGAAHATKRLPMKKIVSICQKINGKVILLGGKEDAGIGENIARESGNHVINLCGKLNLNQSASVLQQVDKVITHDTGLMHIATAFQKEIVSIWGNTIPEFGMYPYVEASKFKIVEVKGLSCRPCSKIGYGKCPKGHFDCMNKIVISSATLQSGDS
jgi:ADP-heptose:LPS heptosyltransferase